MRNSETVLPLNNTPERYHVYHDVVRFAHRVVFKLMTNKDCIFVYNLKLPTERFESDLVLWYQEG